MFYGHYIHNKCTSNVAFNFNVIYLSLIVVRNLELVHLITFYKSYVIFLNVTLEVQSCVTWSWFQFLILLLHLITFECLWIERLH